MKIALVRTASNVLKYGGYNIQEIGLARALLKYGISTDVYARFSNINEDMKVAFAEGNDVIIRPLKGKQIYREMMYYPTLKKDLLNGGYDMVQLLDDSQMMLPFIFKSLKKKGIKTILWQGMYRNFAGKAARIMQICYDFMFAGVLNKYSDLKIAKTVAAKEYLERKNYKNVKVLPVGLDYVEPCRNKQFEGEIKAFKKQHPCVLLYIGAVEHRRNPEFLLEVLNSFDDEKIGLIIIGKGPKWDETKRLVEVFSLQNRCLMFNGIPNNELISVYEQANIFLLPTAYEIYGMVVMEALYYGVPVISTPEAGPAYILSEGRLGECLDLDINKWHNAINYYLRNYISDKDAYYRTNYVEKQFRWEEIADEYYGIINNLINES